MWGDVHQPLHVGAIYLDSSGHEVDPDGGTFDPATKNRGGNHLLDGGSNLHSEWDAIPSSLNAAHFRSAGVAKAKLVPVTTGSVDLWPAAWATDTMLASHAAFQGLTFGPEDLAKKTWTLTKPAGYAAMKAALQKKQLVKAGARLAQLLQAIYP